MYAEKLFKRKNREVKRELKEKNREVERELKKEQALEKQRKLFEQYIEEARNNTELIDQIPYDLDGSLYRELREKYEFVASELYGKELRVDTTPDFVIHAESIGHAFDGVFVLAAFLLLLLVIGISPRLAVAFTAIMALIVIPLVSEAREIPHFSKKQLRLAAECKVVCELLEKRQPETMAQQAKYEIVP